MNFDSNKEREIALDEENEMKCIPKRMNNQMPYQKIEIEIRKNKQWPPITQVNETQMNGNLESHKPTSTNGTIDRKNKLNNNLIKKIEETTSF